MYGDPALWHALLDRLADLAARLAAVAGRRRRARRCSCSTRWAGALRPRRLPALRPPPLAPRCSRRRRPRACPASTSGSAPASCSALMAEAGADVVGVDWRVPLDDARAPPRRRRRPAGQPRPGRRACAAVGRSWRPRPRDVLRRNGGRPGPRLQPRPRRAARDRPRRARPAWSTSCTPGTAGDDGRTAVAAHGLRHAAHAPTRSSPTTPTSGGAGHRRPSSSPTWSPATTPSAASRRWPSAPRPSAPACSAALDARAPARIEVVLGLKHAAPFIEEAVAALAADGRRRARSAWCSRRTTRASASASTSSGPSLPGARRRRGPRHRALGHLSPPTSTSWPPASAAASPHCRARHEGRCSPPTSSPSGSRRRRPVPRRAAGDGRGRRRAAGLPPWGGWSLAWQSRRAHARAVARPRHPARSSTTWPPRRARPASSCARAASWPTTSRCSTTSTSRRRRRAESRASPSPAPRASTTTRRCWRGAGRPRRWTARRPADATSSSWAAASPGCACRLRAAAGGADPPPRVTLLEATTGPRRQDPHHAVRRPAGGRRGPRRVPGPGAVGRGPRRTSSASATSWSPRPPAGRYVWWDGALHPIPDGLVLGVPAGLGLLARSRLLSWPGKARAAVEPLLPAAPPRPTTSARSPAPVRGRGARSAGRPARGQHLRRRHRPAQPRGHRAAGRQVAARTEPAARPPQAPAGTHPPGLPLPPGGWGLVVARGGRRRGGGGGSGARRGARGRAEGRWVSGHRGRR